MKSKRRLFVYDRREILFLTLFTLVSAFFAFTLGLHLGKQVGNTNQTFKQKHISPVKTLPDRVPSQQELGQAAKETEEASEEVLNQNLRDEVNRTGIRLNTHHQVNLPTHPKSPEGGETTLEEAEKEGH